MIKYEMGDKIIFDKFFKRVTTYKKQGGSARDRRFKQWDISTFKTPKKGIVIGYRNLSNGFTDYNQEAGTMFTQTECFKAMLVVFSMYKKPILIPVDNFNGDEKAVDTL